MAAVVSAPSVPSAVLVDLEGTAVSISFVKDTLFPYAVRNAGDFLRESWDDEEVQDAVDGMRKQAADDVKNRVEGAVPIPEKDADKEELIKATAKSLEWLISIDNKGAHMKRISGFIWKKGYEAGELRGHLYEDVRPAVQKWRDCGRKVYVYSSGSVQAQKLLLKHSTAGDAEALFDGFFDTAVGHKREAASYKNILEKINQTSENTLFLTDIAEEGNAAEEAGINVVLLSREGNAELTEEAKRKYPVIKSFAELEVSQSLKRKPSTDEKELPVPKVAKIEIESDVTPEKSDISKPNEKMEIDDQHEPSEIQHSNGIENDNVKSVNAEDETVETAKTEVCETAKTEVCETAKTEVCETAKTEVCKTDKPCENTVENHACPKMEIDAEASSSEKTEDAIVASDEKTEGKDGIADSDVTIENVNSSAETDCKRTPDIIETADEPLEKPKSDADVTITDVTDIVDNTADASPSGCLPVITESPESATIRDDIPTDAPIENNDIDDEKLNQLLGEEGVALEKECDEILSKVEQVTNIDLINPSKILLNKGTKDKTDTPDKVEENADEDPELLLSVDSNNEKILVDLVSNVITETLEEILPKLPPTVDNLEVDEAKPTNGNTAACELNGKSTCEVVNGTKKETSNGNAAHDTNGESEINVKEQGLNGDAVEAAPSDEPSDTVSTNGTKPEVISESNGEPTEIKVKKVPAEEISPEPKAEQTVET